MLGKTKISRLDPAKDPSFLLRYRVGGQRRLDLYKRLAGACARNWKIPDVLESLESHATRGGKEPNHPMAKCLAHWRSRMRRGSSLADAMKGWVPDMHRVLISAGEDRGAAEAGLNAAIFHGSAVVRMSKSVIKAMAYPLGLTGFAVLFLYFVRINIGGMLDGMMPRDEWPGLGAGLAMVLNFVEAGGIFWFLVFLGVSTAGLSYVLPRWHGAVRERFDAQVPIFKEYRLVTGMGFVIAFTGLLSEGAQVTTSFDQLRGRFQPWLRYYADRLQRGFNRGQTFAKSWSQELPSFPHPEMVRELTMVMELQGSFDDVMELVRNWVDVTEDRVLRFGVLFRNVVMMVVGAIYLVVIGGVMAISSGLALNATQGLY